jgi:lysophospholipid acyltransferase (LPLAT)-like uncharacterized protein
MTAPPDREGVGHGAFGVFRRVRDATRAVRRPLKPAINRVLLPFGALLAYLYIGTVNRTVDFEVIGPRHDLRLMEAGEPVIYAFFHSRLFSMFRMLRGRRVAVLVAIGDIGDVISMAARWFGHKPVRGARSGGAARALVEMIREVREGRSAAFAVDGPRGPREEVKPGALYLAQKSGRAIVPIVTVSCRHWNLGIWDRHEIPHPFTKTIALMGEPIRIARGATREEIEEAARTLQGTLGALAVMAADKLRRY